MADPSDSPTPHGADTPWAHHLALRRAFGFGSRPPDGQRRRRKQQEAAPAVPPPPAFRIAWETTEIWRVCDAATGQITETPLAQMTDEHLYCTVVWAVRSSAALYTQAAEDGTAPSQPSLSPALAGRLWLREQPLFRALVKQAIFRCFTFPPDVFQFLRCYVLDRNGALAGYVPWRDPAETAQVTALADLAHMSVYPPTGYYKPIRTLTLDDS